MKQQINLYQPMFRKEHVVVSATFILWLALGFAGALLAWSLLVNYRIGQLEAEYERQLAVEQRVARQLAEMRQTLPPSEPSAELEDEVEQLSQQRRELRASLDALDQRLPAAQVDLADRLDALARRRPHGMWFTRLELADDGRRLSLHGRALSSRLVATYLDALSAEPLLAGMHFRQVRVEAASDDLPGIEFVFNTIQEGRTR